MGGFKNATSKEEFTLLNNYQTQAEWLLCNYVPEKGEMVYCRDFIFGISVWGSKMGDGINVWGLLNWFVPPANLNPTTVNANYRPITSIVFSDFVGSSNGTVYVNTAFQGLTYRVFDQSTGRMLTNTQIQYTPSGGFTLTNGYRIFEEQELIAIF